MTRISGLAALVLGVSMAGCAPSRPVAPSAQPTFYVSLAQGGEVDAAAARSMISLYRANHGLKPLALDPQLEAAALAQARAMAQTARADATGFKKRIAAAGVDPATSVENVSAGYHTLAEAFSGWRDSKPHNSNMLAPAATRMGIATASAPGSKYKVYWALVLAP